MKKTLLFLILLMRSQELSGQTYLDQLYGIPENPHIDIGAAAFELTDASFLFFYDAISAFEDETTIRVGRITEDGTLIFDKALQDSTGNTHLYKAVVTNDGNFVACGHHTNLLTDTTSFYLTKVSEQAEVIWSKVYPTTDYVAKCTTVSPLSEEGFLLGGRQVIYNPNVMPGHALLIRTDSNGQELWRKTYGVDLWQEAIKSIAPTPDGGFLLAGYARQLCRIPRPAHQN